MTSFTISAPPDLFPATGTNNGIPSSNSWFFAIAQEFVKAQSQGCSAFVVDMKGFKRVTLYDWIGILSLIDGLMCLPTTREVSINLKSDRIINLPSPAKQRRIEEQIRNSGRLPSEEENETTNIYRVAGFIESLGTSDILNASHPTCSLSYLWLGVDGAQFKTYYGRKYTTETVVMGCLRIASGNKEHCRQFLNPQRIAKWRAAMETKFRDSHLFRYGELWRVFCHELAANVYEHAGASGFISARVLQAESFRENWCKSSFGAEIQELLPLSDKGVLELCISDGGSGFVKTLENGYRRQSRAAADVSINPIDVLAFAFDELGTCKEQADCWATGRHALGRLLQIIGQYGGAITVRSGGAELVYFSRGGPFQRRPRHLGYEPQSARTTPLIPGTHIQIILPLYPLTFRTSKVDAKSILLQHLPQSFRVDINHVRGHLVPIKDRLGFVKAPQYHDVSQFRQRCEILARDLSSRSRIEPIIFDFGNLQWSPPQFETFIYLMQNVIHNRPVLMVEVHPPLLREIIQLEETEAPTMLVNELADNTPSVTGFVLGDLQIQNFLESVRSPLLALDCDGNVTIVGLGLRQYIEALLELIDGPKSVIQIARGSISRAREIGTILKHSHPLFEKTPEDKWRCSWSRQALAVQGRRVMTRHFDDVADRCEAWHKESLQKRENKKKRLPRKGKYNLPWQDEWKDNFFQSSRILVRQRHADEAAQRLIFRLECGCDIMQRNLSEIRVLACMTAPAILLAHAIHRWWPTDNPPAIADLGPYVMLNPDGLLPTIVSNGGIVIVQDVIDDNRRSGRLHRLLEKQGQDIICIISLVRLVDKNAELGVTSPSDGWNSAGTSCHSFIRLPRPNEVDASIEGGDAFWVEPRTLRPFAYSLLRRDPSKITLDGRPRPKFFPSEYKDVVVPGHHVYGQRHFSVVLDIKRAIDGIIGETMARTIADICVGNANRERAAWERDKSSNFKGEVTMVLMPLHSQIHYLWDKIEIELGERDRRVLVAFLDATLFLGSGPAYRLPLQLLQQIDDAATAMSSGEQDRYNAQIRLLVLDDSTITGRTAETILAEVDRAVEKACRDKQIRDGESCPVEWIRYVNIFNQMPFAKYIHWSNLSEIGRVWKVKFLLDEFWWISGLPVYDEDNCPICSSSKRLQQLSNRIAGVLPASSIQDWITQRQHHIAASAVESPDYHSMVSPVLHPAIDLLIGSHERPRVTGLVVDDGGLAILRFHELLYLSYPPSEVIPCAKIAWSDSDNADQIVAFETFRWQVLQWALCNWPRIIADSARSQFQALVRNELTHLSPLVLPLFEFMALRHADEVIQEIIGAAVEALAQLEGLNIPIADAHVVASRRRLKVLLFDALTVYYFSVTKGHTDSIYIAIGGETVPFEEAIEDYASKLSGRDNMCFLQLLHLSITRPKRFADPGWALRTVSETVFRGRAFADPSKHGHMLLPKLLKDAMLLYDAPDILSLLGASLSLFIAALVDLVPFAYELTREASAIKSHADRILQWLEKRRVAPVSDQEAPQSSLRALYEDHLGIKSPFALLLQQLFNPRLTDIKEALIRRLSEMPNANSLSLIFDIASDVEDEAALIDMTRFCHFLSNWAIEPIRKSERQSTSKISVSRVLSAGDGPKLNFRISTGFDTRKTTQDMTMTSKNLSGELGMLRLFGVSVADSWQEPSSAELAMGLTSCYEVTVPFGFHFQ